MADSILRLKVESQEYDNKLKQAAQGLTRYADECRKVGGTLEVVEKETLDYVRALGQMDTTSRTATGKLAEMKKAFVEFSAQYKQMTEAEKQSPFGKALSQSLDQLKGRIQDSKSQLDDINKSINGGGGISGALDNLAGKFGMNVQSLASWGTALAAGKAALDVAKDAFFASESTVDEWGRVMDSSKSLYEGFLTALNTGDISGYLSRIDSIVQAARAAYDELDRLGTMKTIQAPQMSAQQTENERMRMMIQTGRYIAPVDGRRASMQNGQLLTPDQIRRIEQQLQGGMQKVVTLVGNEVAQTGRAIDAVYNRQAQELGMSLKEFRKGTSSMAEFDKRIKGAEDYRRYEREHTTYDERTGIGHRDASVNPFEKFAKWSTFRVDGQRYNDLVKLIQQRDQQAGQAYSMQSQAYRTMNRAEGVTLRQIMGGGSGGSGGKTIAGEKDDFKEVEEIVGLLNLQKQKLDDLQAMKPFAETEEEIARLNKEIEKANTEYQRLFNLGKEKHIEIATGTSIQNDAGMSGYIASIKQQLETADYGTSLYNGLSAQLADTTTLQNLVGESLKAGLGTAMFDAADATGKDFWTRAMEGGVDNIDWQTIADKINEARKAAGLDAIVINFKTGDVKSQAKEMSKDWKDAAAAVQQVGSAMASIEDPAAKIMGTIGQAIATMALSYAEASKQAAMNPANAGWGWIAFAATGLATMISSIAAIHSATGYANGGMVKGSSYSGDNIPALVDGSELVGLNAGEIVLNAAQSSNVAQGLQSSSREVHVTGEISGENIILAANRTFKRKGQGEIVTW